MKKALCLLGLAPVFTFADQVYDDDLILSGNACIGNGCITDQPFSHEPLELQENNLRVRLVDTGAPTEDATLAGPDYTIPATLGDSWSFVANDSANGGDRYFAFEQHQDPAPRLSDGTATNYTCYFKGTTNPYPNPGEYAADQMDVIEDGTIPAGEAWEDQWCGNRSVSVVRNGLRFTQGSTASNGGVALGFGSDNTEATVSVGNDSKRRRLANLAEGLDAVDVLTVSQMDAYAAQKQALRELDAKLDAIESGIEALEDPTSGSGSLPAGLLATLALLVMRRQRRMP